MKPPRKNSIPSTDRPADFHWFNNRFPRWRKNMVEEEIYSPNVIGTQKSFQKIGRWFLTDWNDTHISWYILWSSDTATMLHFSASDVSLIRTHKLMSDTLHSVGHSYVLGHINGNKVHYLDTHIAPDLRQKKKKEKKIYNRIDLQKNQTKEEEKNKILKWRRIVCCVAKNTYKKEEVGRRYI